jgi:hypothetical protein
MFGFVAKKGLASSRISQSIVLEKPRKKGGKNIMRREAEKINC